MRTVFETVQSYLGLFCEDRKPRKGKGYGFPSLFGTSAKAKTRRQKDSSGRVHSVNSSSPSVDDDTGELPLQLIHKPRMDKTRPLGIMHHPKFHAAGSPSRSHSALESFRHGLHGPFDECTREYYSSCKKRGSHHSRLGPKAPIRMDADMTETEITSCDSDDSKDESIPSGAVVQVNAFGCRYSCEEDRVSGQFSSDKEGIESLKVGPQSSGPLDGGKEEPEVPMLTDAVEAVSRVSVESGTDVSQLTNAECGTLYCEVEKKLVNNELLDKEESSGEDDFVLSPVRGFRRSFPPPLKSLAIQSYRGWNGRSPGACAAGYCLRSLKKDGRFVLKEVKAPTHRFFRVSRKDGRLKLELINSANDSSVEDTASDGICDQEFHTEAHWASEVLSSVDVSREVAHLNRVVHDSSIEERRPSHGDTSVDSTADSPKALVAAPIKHEACDRFGFDASKTSAKALDKSDMFGLDMIPPSTSARHAGTVRLHMGFDAVNKSAELYDKSVELYNTMGPFCLMKSELDHQSVGKANEKVSLLNERGIQGPETPYIDSLPGPGCCEVATLCIQQSTSSWVHPMDWVPAF